MRQFKSKQGSGERRTASRWVPCGQVCISCCGRAEQKASSARRRRPAQNTNNFNDNLNNKTIFSLNVTNRWSFFLRIDFRQNDFLFFSVCDRRRWKMWWRIFGCFGTLCCKFSPETLSGGKIYQNVKPEIVVEPALFAFPGIDFIFEKFY